MEAELSSLMKEQAMLAAQAVARTSTAGLSQARAAEQVQLQRANLLMVIALNIPEYEGEAAMLPDFIERGNALTEQMEDTPGDTATDKAISQLLIGRIATHIRRQIGITINMEWKEVVKRLKEQYGGARKPFQRQAVSLISMTRSRGESPTQFAMRVEEGTRALKARVYETLESSEEAYKVMQVLDLLVSERLRREMPERVKKTLKCVSLTTKMSDLIDIIRDEDEEFGETLEREEKWVRVEPRRPRDIRGGGGRERRPKYNPPPPRYSPPPGPRAGKKGQRRRRRSRYSEVTRETRDAAISAG
jgi:hypothetical protein